VAEEETAMCEMRNELFERTVDEEVGNGFGTAGTGGEGGEGLRGGAVGFAEDNRERSRKIVEQGEPIFDAPVFARGAAAGVEGDGGPNGRRRFMPRRKLGVSRVRA
jgi:hypothetical protein